MYDISLAETPNASYIFRIIPAVYACKAEAHFAAAEYCKVTFHEDIGQSAIFIRIPQVNNGAVLITRPSLKFEPMLPCGIWAFGCTQQNIKISGMSCHCLNPMETS